ncbi:MAG: cytochrome c maturation protein CcmE [Halofilum sp. (in: g-proteobacteria)]|nr:cytochrome c maturation protein CcmE [Halofilum sp. (in: g-proteobacteria)]
MTPRRRRRLAFVGLLVVGVGVAAALLLTAFRENLVYFYTPTDVAEGKAPLDRKFRVGGLVADDSVQRADASLRVRFVVTDTAANVPVVYSGVLPDLFREGQGIVADGRLNGDGEFVAERVLAKHDENYMPPEAAEALQRAGANGSGVGYGGYGGGQ